MSQAFDGCQIRHLHQEVTVKTNTCIQMAIFFKYSTEQPSHAWVWMETFNYHFIVSNQTAVSRSMVFQHALSWKSRSLLTLKGSQWMAIDSNMSLTQNYIVTNKTQVWSKRAVCPSEVQWSARPDLSCYFNLISLSCSLHPSNTV